MGYENADSKDWSTLNRNFTAFYRVFPFFLRMNVL